jgi:hypothetical protein
VKAIVLMFSQFFNFEDSPRFACFVFFSMFGCGKTMEKIFKKKLEKSNFKPS